MDIRDEVGIGVVDVSLDHLSFFNEAVDGIALLCGVRSRFWGWQWVDGVLDLS